MTRGKYETAERLVSNINSCDKILKDIQNKELMFKVSFSEFPWPIQSDLYGVIYEYYDEMKSTMEDALESL